MAIHKISTVGMSRSDWLEERRKSLGGSDIGAVLGMNPYRSPYMVWAEKTGRLPEGEDNEAMRQGRDLEEYVARRFTEKSGLAVRRVNAIMRNDAFPHMHANIDRAVVGQDSGVECKTASALSTSKYTTGEFPAHYYAQSVAYMGQCEYTRYYLAVLILGLDFKIYQLTRVYGDACPDWCESSVYVPEEEIAALRDAAVEFWGYVETDTAPPVDGAEATTETLKTIYAGGAEDGIELFGRSDLFTCWYDLDEQIKELEKQKELIRQTLMSDLGDAEAGTCDGHKVTWKTQQRRTFDEKAFLNDHPEIDTTGHYKSSSYRVFKISTNKN